MPVKQYTIYIKGIESFVKFKSRDFNSLCNMLDELKVNYTTQIKCLITGETLIKN